MPDNVQTPPDQPDRYKPTPEHRTRMAIIATTSLPPAAAARIVEHLDQNKRDAVLAAYKARDVQKIRQITETATAEIRSADPSRTSKARKHNKPTRSES